MATGSSSRSLKKHSDQDQIRKSKSKFKSTKRRRRRDSSISSYSSSSSESDSDDYSRKKMNKLKRRKKESTKPDRKRKKYQKRSRRRHDSPSSSSRDSRSPVRRKAKRRYRSRSRSCSTCSGSEDRSRRRSRGRSLAREECRMERTSESPHELEERWEDRDKIIKAYDDYPSSRNIIGEDAGEDSAMGNDNYEKVRLASVVRSVSDDVAEENNALKEADDLELILRQKALENFRKFRGRLSVDKESNLAVKPVVETFNNAQGSSERTLMEPNKESVGDRKREATEPIIEDKNWNANIKEVPEASGDCVVSSSTEGGSTLPKVANDKKLVVVPGSDKVHRGAISRSDRKDEVVKPIIEGKSWNPNSAETPKPSGNRVLSSSIEGGSMRKELKIEESSNIMLSEQATLAKLAEKKKLVAEPARDEVLRGAASISVRSAGSAPQVLCPNKEDEKCKSIEPMAESASGSQFEQKTFCRVRDGERVQVSYKVYIPKKTPALARRQLQR